MSPKRNKNHGVPIKVLVAALSAFPVLVSASDINVSNSPLAGVAKNYAPNIALTISVEFPTAGAAYSQNEYIQNRYSSGNVAPTLNLNTGLKQKYAGYFDANKCYKFSNPQDPNGFFYPSSVAATSGGIVGICNGVDEYSGNLMNWLTMSALDIFRSTLTGGNRAFGTTSNPVNYLDGDKANATFLRRANVVAGQNANDGNRLHYRGLQLNNVNGDNPNVASILKMLPKYYFQTLFPDATGAGYSGSKGKFIPAAAGFVHHETNQLVPNDSMFADDTLYFINIGFTTRPARKILTSKNQTFYAYQDLTKVAANSTNPTVRAYLNQIDRTAVNPNVQLPVVVKVCDSNLLEANCVQYGSNYKPEGELQKYGRKKAGSTMEPMRVSVFGYLNAAGHGTVDGGVLRAQMKYLDRNDNGRGAEWDAATGVFYTNPDAVDASNSNVDNSGVINYVNKFGDATNYKVNDHAAELYYTALNYLKNGDRNLYKPSNIQQAWKDGFPAIYNWDDPLTGFTNGANNAEAQCRANTIIFIGDTNTWYDDNLPNFGTPSRPAGPTPSDTIQTGAILEKIVAAEGRPGTARYNRGAGTYNIGGAGHSPAGIAALAYWARTNDLRPDIPGNQYSNNFMIDVLETGDSKADRGNSYYWAAKYGGFDYRPGSIEAPNDNRSSWTDDAVGHSSDPVYFPEGMPRNFAIANTPENMITALKNAFTSAGKYTDPSQTAYGLTTEVDEVLDLSKAPLVLQSAFNFTDLSGDLIAKQVSWDAANSRLALIEKWRASAVLNAQFRNGGNWGARQVYTKNGHSTVPFNATTAGSLTGFAAGATSAGVNVADVANYILGDASKEVDGSWRKRTSLIGTIVNSSSRAILTPKQNPRGCSYDNYSAVTQRVMHYAVAANDGMLHIVNDTGREVFAYIPTTALPKLAATVAKDATHEYLNDGSPVLSETCVNGKAKSVLVGSAGRGGASVYAMDVTDLSNPNASNVMWEFSNADDSDLGLTISTPSITRTTTDANSTPMVIVSSGYNNADDEGYLFILDGSNTSGSWTAGTNYQKIRLGKSGVGTPFVFDQDGDGVPERVYVGDLEGKLWRIDYDAANKTWTVAYGGNPMFVGAAPITSAPYAYNRAGKVYVVVGTGQYLNESGFTPSVQNYAYGLFDEDNATASIGVGDLLEQTIGTDTVIEKAVKTLYNISNNELKPNHRGWSLKLLPGQVIASNALIRGGKLAEFTAIRRTDGSAGNICQINGSTSIISLDLIDGSEYDKPIFDSNRDGSIDEKDKTGGMLEEYGKIGPSATPIRYIHPITSKIVTGYIAPTDAGDVLAPVASPTEKPTIRRLSWREIF